jgi:hypothetical protein
LSRGTKYKYEEYHKVIDEILYKKCATHEEIFKEEKWFPCTNEYFYKNDKNKSDGISPTCKECEKKRARKWAIENPEKKRESVRKNRKAPETRAYHRKKGKRQRDTGWRAEWEKKNKDKLYEYSQNRKHKKHDITNLEWEACKKYFDYKCAYCGLPLSEHYRTYAKKLQKIDFHKDHADNKGKNDITNCIPSCGTCNDSKWKFTLDEWYNKNNINFTQERLDKIIKWLMEDCFQYIEEININENQTS